MRDYNGHISSLLIRNDKAKVGKSGKVENKYVAFSSAGKTKGNKVRQTTHCPVVKCPAIKCESTTVRITEGILKADIATALDDIYCFGMHGLNIQDDLSVILNEVEVQELIISIDSGEDSNVDVLRCKANLIKLCREIGIDFKIELWDSKYGKGIDDVLANGFKDKIKYATDDEIEVILESANDADPENGDWLYVVQDQKFLHKSNLSMLTKSQFADKFRLEKVDFANKLIANGFEMVDKISFMPNGEKIFVEGGNKCFNIWTPAEIIPVEGNVDPFVKHIEYILPDEYQRGIFLDWISHNIQHPGIKILWALVVVGDEGIGKSIFGYILRQILGENNVGIPTNDQLHEPYTDWQKNKCLIIIEELLARGKIELMNKLKPIITQPTTQIREMRQTSYEAPNRFNLLAYTNHDDALYLTEKDRRYGILKSPAVKMDEKYYTELWEWVKNKKNLQAILHYLMSRDLSKFNPAGSAPKTDAKNDMVKMSMSSLDEWISNCVENNVWPFNRDIVILRHIKARGICPQGFEKISDFKWASAMKNCGATYYNKQVLLSDKSRAWPWIIGKNRSILMNLSPPEIVKLYETNTLEYDGMNPVELEKFESNIVNFSGEDSNPVKDDEPF